MSNSIFYSNMMLRPSIGGNWPGPKGSQGSMYRHGEPAYRKLGPPHARWLDVPAASSLYVRVGFGAHPRAKARCIT